MMINDMKKNELTEQEMNGVSGGFNHRPNFWNDFEKEYRKAEAERQESIRRAEEARQEAIRIAEAENNATIHPHGGGVSGSW